MLFLIKICQYHPKRQKTHTHRYHINNLQQTRDLELEDKTINFPRIGNNRFYK